MTGEVTEPAAADEGLSTDDRCEPGEASPVEVSSPVCYAAEASDAYMGYLERDSLIVELNILLEAERAGAKVAAQLARVAERPQMKALAQIVHRDEVGWCKMLIAALERLDAQPSQAVGGFYDKAMAITDVEARFVFVNRGQAWVVRKLKTLIPKVRADQLHADLLRMLAGHDHSITHAAAVLARIAETNLLDTTRS